MEIVFVFYLFVQDQTSMPDVQEAIFVLIRRPENPDRIAKLTFHEIIALLAHGGAIVLGCILIHNTDYPATIFLKFGYAIRMRELDESSEEVPKGSMIGFRAIIQYAQHLKDTWHAAYSIIDLVDVTDFYLLLFESDLYAPEDGIANQKTQQNRLTGLCDWEQVRIFWVLGFVACSFGRCLDTMLLWVFTKLNRKHLARWSELPDGMRFWQLYVMKREVEKQSKKDEGESITGPYPAAWRCAKKYYDFNLPRKKNQQAFCAGIRSLFFIEAPFLYWRLLCSEKYGIIASSLLIKNVLSLIYDFYITSWGI
jgi:hypothetical protein